MKKLGIYAALALFIPSAMADDVIPTSVALAVAEASANINWTLETDNRIDALASMQLADNHQRLNDKISRQLEQQIDRLVAVKLRESE